MTPPMLVAAEALPLINKTKLTTTGAVCNILLMGASMFFIAFNFNVMLWILVWFE